MSWPPAIHLIFENWDASIARQAGVLGPLIESACGKSPVRILDAACGIGTQTIGLAMRGHAVTGSDLSKAAILRARLEAAARNLSTPFYAADLCDLSAVPGGPFDAVLIADNAFAHLLSEDNVRQAASSVAGKLNTGGILLTTIRDYDALARERPAFQGPAFYDVAGAAALCIKSGTGPASATTPCTFTSPAKLPRVGNPATLVRHFTPCRARRSLGRLKPLGSTKFDGWRLAKAGGISRSCWRGAAAIEAVQGCYWSHARLYEFSPGRRWR